VALALAASAVECQSVTVAKDLDTEEVDGSNPFGPTIFLRGPTRRHGLQNVPVTGVTLLVQMDFRAVAKRLSSATQC